MKRRAWLPGCDQLKMRGSSRRMIVMEIRIVPPGVPSCARARVGMASPSIP